MATIGDGFEKHYSDEKFWAKVWKHAKKAGRPVMEKALLLYYALPAAPIWAKSVIVSALGYFIWPLDVIPDFTPPAPVGYSDDLLVMAMALAAVAMHFTPEVKAKAEAKLREWFGDPAV